MRNIAILRTRRRSWSATAPSNTVTIRFRDIRSSGKILDALVSEGANQISGPNLVVDKPEAALDEARAKAIAEGTGAGRTLCAIARACGSSRVVAVSESGGYARRRRRCR